MISLWGLATIFTTTFVIPFAQGAYVPTLPLPHSADYATLMRATIGQTSFSTDPRPVYHVSPGRVAACTDGGTATLEAFLVTTNECVTPGEQITYRIFLKNTGSEPATDVRLQFTPPAASSIVTSSIPADPIEIPGTSRNEFAVTISTVTPTVPFTSLLRLSYNNCGRASEVVTSANIAELCEVPPPPPPGAALPSREPAIICGPGDTGCAAHMPTLGVNFERAQQPAQQPIVCSSHDPSGCTPNHPNLGVRFNEAIADIIPGECRVLEDSIIADPAYHDALNRRARPAARFMLPLYESGRDFSRLIHENELLGITQLITVKQKLREAHHRNWQEQVALINEIATGRLAPADALAAYDRGMPTWLAGITALHADFTRTYTDIQTTRTAKFDPVATQAIANAITSISIACRDPSDGGLGGLLPGVKAEYDASLGRRQAAYATTHSDSLAAYQGLLTSTRITLAAAASDPAALAHQDLTTAAAEARALLRLTNPYETHYQLDAATDNDVRLLHWEIALDTPKTLATSCELEKVLGPRVETTWCESGPGIVTLLRPPGPPRTKDTVEPPDIINDDSGPFAPEAVAGTVCGPSPGDPWWAADCSCQCNEVVPCPALGGATTLCQLCRAVTRHDRYVTSQEECLSDGPKHSDPFF